MKIKFLLFTALFTLMLSCDSDDGGNSTTSQDRLEVSVDNVDVVVNRYTAIRTEFAGRNILNVTLFLANGAAMTVNVEGATSAGIFDVTTAGMYSLQYFPSGNNSNADGTDVSQGEIEVISHDMSSNRLEVEFDELSTPIGGSQGTSYQIEASLAVSYNE